MVIDDKFYVGGARDRQIIRMVRGIRRFHRVKYVPGVFVITLPLFGDGILEGDAIHIVGAAPSRFQAVLLVRDIIDDIYKKTGDVDVERFFAS